MRLKQRKRILSLVKKNYQEIAKHFSQTRQKRLWPEVIDFAKKIKNGEKVLDLGCGNGRLLDELKEEVNYLGIDNSKNLIDIAKENYKKKNTAKFKVSDIVDLEGLENKYDYIFLVAVLQHIPSKDLRIKVLKKIKKSLNKDGKLFVSVWNLVDNKKYKKKIKVSCFLNWLKGLDKRDLLFYWKNQKGEKISLRYYHAFTEKELKKLFLQAGFKIEKLFKTKDNYYIVLK